VLDAARQPVANVTIALYQKDTWVRSLGYVCTDNNGYFVLNVADAAKNPGPFSLRVLRSKGTVYIDPHPVSPEAAQVEYREIVIGDTSGICPPPAAGPAPPAERPPSPDAPPADTPPASTPPASGPRGSAKK
jgi:hypothetical protein